MKKLILLFLISFGTLNCNYAQFNPWAKSASGSGTDAGNSISTDASGNVFVTGSFSSPTITFGTTTLTNAGSNDIFIVKYDSLGNVLWAISEGGSGDDNGSGISTDASGNVFVTGGFSSPSITTLTNASAGTNDFFILKYDGSGNFLWAKSAGGSGDENGSGISTDASGNVFVTGSFSSSTITFGSTTLINDSAGTNDILIVKYDPSGNVLWAESAGGSNDDNGYSISTDASGSVFITGTFNNPTITFGTTTLVNADITGSDVFIVKYDPSGNVLWAKSAGGNFYDYGFGISTDASGNVFVTGSFQSPTIAFDTTTLTNAGSYAFFIAKYDASGNMIWAKSAGGIGWDSINLGISTSTDASGDVFVTGIFYSSSITFDSITVTNSNATYYDFFIVKYDPSGNVIWAKSAGGNGNDYGYAISTDANGNVFVTGSFGSPTITFGPTTLTNTGSDNFYIAKLSGLLVQSTVIINTQPVNQVVCENSSATFTVAATGVGSLIFQWQCDNGTGVFTNITGETSPTLTITGASLSFNGFSYRVIIDDNTFSPKISSAAYLTVNPLTMITSQPYGANLCKGNALSLSVSATGAGSLVYQWNLNGSPIPGATSSTYAVSSVTGPDAGSYKVDITGGCNTLTSTPMTVTVNGVTITANPIDQTICENGNHTFSVTASGLGTLSYQWQSDNGTGTFTGIAGKTSSTLALGSVSLSLNGHKYRVVIKDNNLCPVTSASATLTVNPSTLITSQPIGATFCSGSPLNLSVVASGSGTLGYQWNLNSSPITNATSSTYYVSNVTGADAGSYTVVINGGCNTLTSTAAIVKINGVTITTNPANQVVNENDNAAFAVSATGLGVLSYQWQSDNGTGTFSDIAGETSPTLSLNGVSLALNGFKYRVVMKDDNACTKISSAVTLTVNQATGIKAQVTAWSISVYPNPFSQSTIFSINSSTAGIYKLSITNSLGESIAEYEFKNQNTFTLSRADIPDGLYFYLLSDEEGKSSSGKLVVE